MQNSSGLVAPDISGALLGHFWKNTFFNKDKKRPDVWQLTFRDFLCAKVDLIWRISWKRFRFIIQTFMTGYFMKPFCWERVNFLGSSTYSGTRALHFRVFPGDVARRCCKDIHMEITGRNWHFFSICMAITLCNIFFIQIDVARPKKKATKTASDLIIFCNISVCNIDVANETVLLFFGPSHGSCFLGQSVNFIWKHFQSIIIIDCVFVQSNILSFGQSSICSISANHKIICLLLINSSTIWKTL